MAKIGVSIIVSMPHCPTVWNTNDDTILETGQNQEMWNIETFPHFQKIDKVKKYRYVPIYRDVSTFSKLDKLKKCGNVSIYRRFHILKQ